MPYFTSATERMALPSDMEDMGHPGAGASAYWVEFRKRLTHDDQQAANDAINEFLVNVQGQEAKVDAKLHITADEPVLLARMIVAWNLDDDSGTVAPINRESVGRLSREDTDAIIARIRALNPRRTGTDQKN